LLEKLLDRDRGARCATLTGCCLAIVFVKHGMGRMKLRERESKNLADNLSRSLRRFKLRSFLHHHWRLLIDFRLVFDNCVCIVDNFKSWIN